MNSKPSAMPVRAPTYDPMTGRKRIVGVGAGAAATGLTALPSIAGSPEENTSTTSRNAASNLKMGGARSSPTTRTNLPFPPSGGASKLATGAPPGPRNGRMKPLGKINNPVCSPGTAVPPLRRQSSVRRTTLNSKMVLDDDDRSPQSEAFPGLMLMLDAVENDRAAGEERIESHAARMRLLLRSWAFLTNETHRAVFTDRLSQCYHEAAEGLVEPDVWEAKSFMAEALVNMVGKAVTAFANPPDFLELASEMGGRHALYDVTEAHYQALRTAFFNAAPEMMPTKLRVNTLPLWQTMWETLIRTMVAEANNERGLYYTRRKHEKWVDIVQKVMSAVEIRQQAPPGSERRNLFIMRMYDHGVASNMKLKRYFLFREPRTADRSCTALMKIVNSLNDMSLVDTYLEELGIRHIDYDMTEETLKAFRKPFLDTIREYVGDDISLWNANTIKALGELWDYISLKWSRGFNVNKKSMTSNCAPDGATGFCIVFTDIEASTKLWASDRVRMREAVKNHHRIVRSFISDFGGYEVKTIGDSFMIACKDPLVAVKIAIGIQLDLMRAPITEGFEMIDNPSGTGDDSAWRKDSLRVRIGIHYCENAGVVYDSVQRRYDYYGPAINCASRVESAAAGGQVLMSGECHEQLLKHPDFTTKPRDRILCGINTANAVGSTDHLRPLSDYLTFVDLGSRELKGIRDPVKLIEVVHEDLKGRQFPSCLDLPSGQISQISLPTSMTDKSTNSPRYDDLDSVIVFEWK